MPTSTYDLIASNVLSSSAATIDFTSIGSGYRDLVLVGDYKMTNASGELIIRYNSDTGTNYHQTQMWGDGSSTGSNSFNLTRYVPSANIGENTSVATLILFHIMDYSATDKHKTGLLRVNNSTEGVLAQANRWANTAAITSINIGVQTAGDIASGSSFYLYGIAS